MAQSGYTPISLYFSATGAAVPTAGNLVAGELALNTNDGKLYFKNSSGVVTLLAGSTSGPAGGSTTQVQYNNAGVLAGITGATSNGTVLTLVAPVLGAATATSLQGIIGNVTPAAGSFTTLGASSTATLNTLVSSGATLTGGTINGMTVGATTASTGAFTTLSATGAIAATVGDILTPAVSARFNSNNTRIGFGIDNSNGLAYLGFNINPKTVSATVTYDLSSYAVTQLRMDSGQYVFKYAAAGTAGADVTFSTAATLSSTGLAVTSTLSGGTSGTAYSFSGSAPATSLTLGSSGNLSVGSTLSHGKIGSFLSDATTTFSSLGYGMLSLMNSSNTNNNYTWMTFNESNQNYTGAIGTQNIVHSGPSGAVSGDLLFATKTAGLGGFPTEKMRLDSSGNLLVGTTTTSAYFDSKITAFSPDTYAPLGGKQGTSAASVILLYNAGTTGDNLFAQFITETSPVVRGSISYNRSGGLVAYNVTSDYRAKDINGPVTNSGTLIDSVPVYMGKMKDATQERPMFIAHEVPAYAHTGEKDAVDKDGKPVYQQMDASALIPVMWAELQSLRARVAQLESKP